MKPATVRPQSEAKSTTPATPDPAPSFTVPFNHRGKDYSIYKREQTRTAPYQCCVIRNGKRHRQSLETNDSRTAVERAKSFIDALVAEKWDAVNALKCRNKDVAMLSKVLDHYSRVAQLSAVTVRHNTGAMKWLIETATGKPLDAASFPMTRLNAEIIGQFQRAMVTRYQAKAPKTGTQREARERALRTSRSVRSPRSLRAPLRDVGPLQGRGNRVAGVRGRVHVARVEGRVTKVQYHAPDDAVIQKGVLRDRRLS